MISFNNESVVLGITQLCRTNRVSLSHARSEFGGQMHSCRSNTAIPSSRRVTPDGVLV